MIMQRVRRQNGIAKVRSQRGASSLSIISGIALAAILLTFGIKVGPLYMDNMSIDQAIESAAGNNFSDMTRSEIQEALSKSFRVNNVSANPRDFDIEQNGSTTELSYYHEERVNIFSNIDVVVTFTNTYSTAD